MGEIMMLKGGNLTFLDVINYNKIKEASEILSFFILMEVYGHQFPINYFEPHVTQLSMQRRRS